MTEHPPDPAAGQSDLEPGTAMPRWVPLLIGAVLVGLAALAVFTGLRYRSEGTMTDHVPARREARTQQSGPPGEPGAGASLVLHGESGDNTPSAKPPVPGQARAVITGGPGGVQSTVRLWARRGIVFNVLPERTAVFVNEIPIGEVAQFNTMDEVYDFAEPGSYTVRLVAPGGATKSYVVTASDDAATEVARISVKLE